MCTENVFKDVIIEAEVYAGIPNVFFFPFYPSRDPRLCHQTSIFIIHVFGHIYEGAHVCMCTCVSCVAHCVCSFVSVCPFLYRSYMGMCLCACVCWCAFSVCIRVCVHVHSCVHGDKTTTLSIIFKYCQLPLRCGLRAWSSPVVLTLLSSEPPVISCSHFPSTVITSTCHYA